MRKNILGLIGIVALLITLFINIGIPHEIAVVVGITIVAVIFWFGEVLPLHITGLLICSLLATVGGLPARDVFSNIFDPIVVLLFGGLVLAILLQEYELDKKLVCMILKKDAYPPKYYLLVMMFLSAFLSMWISNTAAAALIIPLVVEVIRTTYKEKKKQQFGLAIIIGTAYAATIGGMGTVVGSPPNFLAIKALQELGMNFGFGTWMLFALPITIVLLLVAWRLLILLFPVDTDKIYMPKNLDTGSHQKKQQHIIGAIFLLTVIGWLTTSWTGVSSSIIALLPLFIAAGCGLLPKDYLKRVNWGILILIGSGIALGQALYTSGTAAYLTDLFFTHVGEIQPVFLLFFMGVFGVLLTMFASNTASAALLIPLITPIGVSLGMPLEFILFIGLAVSLDFTAPMGTPPNAMAYSTGLIKINDMAKAGLLLSVLSVIVLLCIALFVRPMINGVF